jgi:hypothetical protein
MLTLIIPERDSLMADIESAAVRAGLNVITDGNHIMLCSEVLPGWRRMSIGESHLARAVPPAAKVPERILPARPSHLRLVQS